MITWPWNNQEKELEKLLKEAKDGPLYEIKNVDDFFDEIRNKKYTFWEDLWLTIKFKSNDFAWYVYRLFKPCHQRIRKVIPRRWCDLTELTLLINFEIVKSYVEEEMSSVRWDGHEAYVEVANWLNSSYQYITKEREELQKQYDEELSISCQKKREIPYHERYAEPNRIEALIDEKDKNILIGIAKYRQYLWS